MRLTRLSLTQFRNYPSLTWRPAAAISVLFGPNGSGKTSLLEAVSLLVPGRGLRGARLSELARYGEGATGSWAVAGRFDSAQGPCDIGTGTQPGAPERRLFRLDGAPPRSQAELAERVAAVWLTPQMDRLFNEAASARRRFLDRLVWALEPGHARQVAAHDAAMASRNRLLSQARHDGGTQDRAWLDALEHAMARHAVAATAARMALVSRLNIALEGGLAGAFPAGRIALLCPIAEKLAECPALAAEDWLRAGLAAARARDAATGSAALGAHRADMTMTDAAGTPASLASTGEQKALLVGLVLGHAELIGQARGAAPLLLLDEPAVHLDPGRRAALFDALTRLPAQALLTGTDAEPFLPLAGRAEGLLTGGGRLQPDMRFPVPIFAAISPPISPFGVPLTPGPETL